MTTALLVGVALAIGASVGLTGVGGFLVVPAMVGIAGTTLTGAVATALLANFGAMGLTGGVYVYRRAWSPSLLAQLSAGSLFAAVGAWLAIGVIPGTVYSLAVSFFLAAMGIRLLAGRSPTRPRATIHPGKAVLVGVLAEVAAVSGGVGGPAVSVPGLAGSDMRLEDVVGTALLHGVFVSGLSFVIVHRTPLLLGSDTALVALTVIASSVVVGLLRGRQRPPKVLLRLVGALAIAGSILTLAR